MANLVGRVWVMGVGIIFVPVYIHFIGIEAFGLIGVFTTIQTIMSLLDMGLTTTLNRELSKHGAIKNEEQYMNDLVRTLEIIYIGISLSIGVVLLLSSYFLSHTWVKPDLLDRQTILEAFMLMSINFSIQLPWGLYEGGLMGLQKQVTLNAINIVLATLKAPVAILILWLISPTIQAFLIWQIILNVIQLLLFRYFLWKYLPKAEEKPRFNKAVIKRSGRFALGVMGTSLLVVLFTQIDKIVLSNTVKLNQFGYYALAASVAAFLSIVITPVAQAVFPRITALVAKKDDLEIKRIFHTSSQMITTVVLPIGMGVFIFANEILLFWTRSTDIAANAGPVLQFLILGNMINSLMTIPYQYTISLGWLRFGINISLVSVVVFFPCTFWAAINYGIKGGAFMWMVLNAAFLIFAMAYLFSKVLKSERRSWYLNDVIRPVTISVLIAIPFYLIHEYFEFSTLVAIILCGICILFCFSATIFFGAPALKPEVKKFIQGIRFKKS